MFYVPIAILALTLVVSGASAQVRKCVDSNGKVTYSDFICGANTAKETGVSTGANTLDGSAMRNQAIKDRQTAAADQAVLEKGGQCKFSYYALGDKYGKMFAAAAKTECLDNLRAKATGQPQSKEAYNRWKDHSSQKQASRDAAITRAANAANAQAIANSNRNAIDDLKNKSYECRPNTQGSAFNCR